VIVGSAGEMFPDRFHELGAVVPAVVVCHHSCASSHARSAAAPFHDLQQVFAGQDDFVVLHLETVIVSDCSSGPAPVAALRCRRARIIGRDDPGGRFEG